MRPMRRGATLRSRQAGFTIVEMMVALGIGLVVVMGLAVMFVNMKTSFSTQDKLAQLQDGERLSMAMLGDTVHEAGYYPDPRKNDRGILLKADADATWGAMAGGQAILGTAATSAKPETLSTRYASDGADKLMNCVGGAVGKDHTVRNVFYVDAASSTLVCSYALDGGAWVTDGGKPFALVAGVKSMSVMYGVDTNADGSVDRYLGPGAVAATQWPDVHSVQVTLVFLDPVNKTNTKLPTWVQTINLMNFKS
jgi:type IV pilus assembly protein PilW